MVRVGILGTGFMGQTHAEIYQQLQDVEILGVTDTQAEKGKKLAQKLGCKYYQNPDDLLRADSVDIIDICLPTFLHEEYAVKAALEGKNILCEKPLALKIESVDKVIEAVNKTGVKFMVGQVLRFWPEYVKIKELYDSGILGDVKMAYANRLAQPPNWSNWFADTQKSGGGLFDLHLHDIDYLRHIFGPIQTIYATGEKSENGAWNHVVTILHFAKGPKACVEACWEMPSGYPFTANFRAVGEKATVEYSLKAGHNLENRDSAMDEIMLFEQGKDPEPVKVEKQDAYFNEIKYFVECIKENHYPTIITPSESKEVMNIIFAIEESLESGKVVDFEKFAEG